MQNDKKEYIPQILVERYAKMYNKSFAVARIEIKKILQDKNSKFKTWKSIWKVIK